MQRILLVLAVALVMAVFMAATALAQGIPPEACVKILDHAPKAGGEHSGCR
jgi:hypothetical protein